MYFEGDQARKIGETAQNILMDTLRGQLNAAPYAAALGKPVFVVASEEEAAQHYQSGTGGNAFVEVLAGEDNGERWGKTIGGQYRDGTRHNMTFLLDMSLSDHAAARVSAAGASAADRRLCDAVRDIIRRGYDELWEQGLEEVEISADPESQRAATKRNPHTISCAVYTIDD